MNQQSIHQDKRLHNLDQECLIQLTRFADNLSKTPENQKMSVFLNIMQEIRTKNLTFSSNEQDLLFTVLTENMNEKDKKMAAMIRHLSSQQHAK